MHFSPLRWLGLFWFLLAVPIFADSIVVPLTQSEVQLTGTVGVALPLANGQMIIGGDFNSVSNVPQQKLARLNADGTLDQSWRPKVARWVSAIAVEGDEVYFNSNGYIYRTKLSGDGEIDPDWSLNENKLTELETADQIAVKGGFVYLLLNTSENIDGKNPKTVLRRYFRSGDGKRDASWSQKTFVNQSFLHLLVDEQAVYVGHQTYSEISASPAYIDRYSLRGSGARDSKWRVTLSPLGGVSVYLYSFALDGGYVYLAGSSFQVGRTAPVGVARYSTLTAKADLTWPEESIATGEKVNVVVQNGTAYIASRSAVSGVRTGSDNPTGIARFTHDFGGDAPASLRLLAAGSDCAYVQPLSAGLPTGFLRIDDETGVTDRAFRPRVNASSEVKQVLQTPAGTTYLAGRFDSVGEVAASNLVRFSADGRLDTTWIAPTLVLRSALEKIGSDGAFIYALDGERKLTRITASTPALIDSTWNPLDRLSGGRTNINARILQVTFTEDSAFVIYADSIGGLALERIPFIGDGTPDPAWHRVLTMVPDFLLIHKNALYVGGRGGTSRYGLAAGGVVDGTWKITLKSEVVRGYTADDQYLYLGAGAILRRYSLSGTGAPDTTWVPNFGRASLSISSLLVLDSKVYVSGNIRKYVDGVLSSNGVLRLDAAGQIDPEFTLNIPYIRINSTGENQGPRWLGTIGNDPLLGGNFEEINGAAAGPAVIFTSLPPPTLTQAGPFVFARAAEASTLGINFFRVTAIEGGTLVSGVRSLAVDDFVSLEEGNAGLEFNPTPDFAGTPLVSLASATNESAEATGVTSRTVVLTDTTLPKNRYNMSVASLRVREGTGSAKVSVQKIGALGGTVSFRIEEGSARANTHFTPPVVLSVNFPPGDGLAEIDLPVLNDELFTGNREFRVVLSESADGLLLNPEATVVTIVDDDPLGDTNSLAGSLLAPVLEEGDASLTVTIGEALFGAWRILGEPVWHPSGFTVSGLARGNYVVEFRPTSGYRAPGADVVPVDTAEEATYSADYLLTADTDPGSLAITIKPNSIATAAEASRGQWRVVGDSTWRNSAEIILDLPAGPYEVEFKPVSGRKTPAAQRILVGSELRSVVSVTYEFANQVIGALPAPVDFATQKTAPYSYVGQIRTPAGFATGTAVHSHAVLTVAHALFDDANLSNVTEAFWLHGKARGKHEPQLQEARGWYIRDGYSAQRTADLADQFGGVGISSPESQQLDVAVLYFFSPCAQGSYSGYLRTDSGNDWLLVARRRILAGYPVDNVDEDSKGLLQATDPDLVSTFEQVTDPVRATDDLKGFGGMSGGPLFVEEQGVFTPAGVFLGGTDRCLVRVIDRDAVDLINRAELSGNGGENNVGGGAVQNSPGFTGSLYAPTYLGCTLDPGTILSLAGWRVAGGSDPSYHQSGDRVSVDPGTVTVEFRPVAGYATPAPKDVILAAGDTKIVTKTYKLGALITTTADPATGSGPTAYYEIGKLATLVAKPKPGYIFRAWKEDGVVISESAKLIIPVTVARNLEAVFEPGAYLRFAGTYAGLHMTGDVADGHASVTITVTGSFTGKVVFNGKTFKLKGTLDAKGSYSSAAVSLNLDRSSSVGVLSGEVYEGSVTTKFSATESPYKTLTPTSLVGAYTVLLPSADSSDATLPTGNGYATVKVTAAGAITFTGKTADGVAISGASQIIEGDYWPFYGLTFSGAGKIIGQLQFQKTIGVSDAAGSLVWVRPSARPDLFYPLGFTTTLSAVASSFVAPAVDYTTATLKLKDGGITGEVTRALTITSGKTVLAKSLADPLLSLTINKTSGLITGPVTNPATGLKVQMKGVIFQATRRGAGFISTPVPNTGAFEMVPVP